MLLFMLLWTLLVCLRERNWMTTTLCIGTELDANKDSNESIDVEGFSQISPAPFPPQVFVFAF